MLNILPTTEKKKILLEYRLRLAVVFTLALGFIVIASLVLLFPAYLLAVSKFKASENQVVALEKKYGSSAQEKEISAQIREINNKIILLSSGDTSKRLSPTEAITNILNLKGELIKIYTFAYESTASKERIVLTGVARDRDSLANFFETLKKSPTFTSVTMPISSYVRSENIDFSVVLERDTRPPEKKK